MDVTIKGIPVEKLLEVYEKYSAAIESLGKLENREKKYRDSHKEERNKKAREYYYCKKEARQAAQALPETQADSQATPENCSSPP